MTCMDRVALMGLLWFVLGVGGGDLIGHAFKTPGTGMVTGFFLAAITVLLWPWILPPALDDWMNDPRA